MLVLTIDTSTTDSLVGLAFRPAGGGSWLPRGAARAPGNVHVEQLAPMIEQMVREGRGDRLAAVVVGVGPGPYTGLRIGVATAVAYGDALGLPVYGACGLDAIADEAADSGGTRLGRPGAKNLLVVADAKRREVFWARYREGRRIGELGVGKPAQLPELLGGFVPEAVAGAAHLLDGTALAGVPRSDVVAPSPAGLARAVPQALHDGEAPGPIVPLYLRPPDAKPPASMKPMSGAQA